MPRNQKLIQRQLSAEIFVAQAREYAKLHDIPLADLAYFLQYALEREDAQEQIADMDDDPRCQNSATMQGWMQGMVESAVDDPSIAISAIEGLRIAGRRYDRNFRTKLFHPRRKQP